MPKDGAGRDRGGGAGGRDRSGSDHGNARGGAADKSGAGRGTSRDHESGRSSSGASSREGGRTSGAGSTGRDRGGREHFHEGRDRGASGPSRDSRESSRTEKPARSDRSSAHSRDHAGTTAGDANRATRETAESRVVSNRTGDVARTQRGSRTGTGAGRSGPQTAGGGSHGTPTHAHQAATLAAMDRAVNGKQGAPKDKHEANRVANQIREHLLKSGYDKARVQVRDNGIVTAVAEKKGERAGFVVGPGFQHSESYNPERPNDRSIYHQDTGIAIREHNRDERGNPDLGPSVEGGGRVLSDKSYDKNSIRESTEGARGTPKSDPLRSDRSIHGANPVERPERGSDPLGNKGGFQIKEIRDSMDRSARPQFRSERTTTASPPRIFSNPANVIAYDKPLETPLIDPIDFLGVGFSIVHLLASAASGVFAVTSRMFAAGITRGEVESLPFQIQELLTKLGYSEAEIAFGKSPGQVFIKTTDPRKALVSAYREVVQPGTIAKGARTSPAAHTLQTKLGSGVKAVIRSPNASKTARESGHSVFTMELHNLPGSQGVQKWNLKFHPLGFTRK